jgi:uncharacterized protein YggE
LRHILSGLLVSLLLPAYAVHADGPPRDPYIQVNGHGELHVVPDLAYVSVAIEKTDKDAKTARADVEARSAKVIALARKLGLADKDIEAPSVTVYPDYECVNSSVSSGGCTNKLMGQHVSRGITLTLRDLSRYGDLADGLFAAGVTDLGNVVLDRSDRRALESQARALAVQDAHDKALGLAKSADVALGPVYSIAEQGSYIGPRPMMAAANMAKSSEAAPEYLNGKIDISADVQAYYLINK